MIIASREAKTTGAGNPELQSSGRFERKENMRLDGSAMDRATVGKGGGRITGAANPAGLY